MEIFGQIMLLTGAAILTGFCAAQLRIKGREEGAQEAGALLRKLCDQCPEGSYARDAYEFVLDDFQKAAQAREE